MNQREEVAFLFTIVKAIQHSFTSPVIFFTQKDFAENIFIAYRNMHTAYQKKEPSEKIVELVNAFHIEWLEAVLDVEKFSKRVKDTPRGVILKALDYTIGCIQLRFTHILDYISEMRSTMTDYENHLMKIELKVIKDMQDTVNSALLEKKLYISSQADQTEYLARIHDETEELLHWLDRLDDSLAIEFCNLLIFKEPLAPTSLTTTLKNVIEEVAMDPTPEAKRVAELIHVSCDLSASTDRINERNEQEISKISEKIRELESRISQLKLEDSHALMAMKHKTMFLEERLQSLENIKMSIKKLRKDYREKDSSEKFSEARPLRIFNHLLPHQNRSHLVEKLMQIWKKALTETEQDHESIIDILSVTKIKEVYSDENGNFTVDKFGRKIYRIGDEEISYQLNEQNDLVPLQDDETHVYYYDSCGRYYMDPRSERVYKHHDGASEYMLSKEGFLVKVREKKDGIEYLYDGLGRYYVNAEGRHIYRDVDSNDEYDHDGLGNLVKIYQGSLCYEPCPIEPLTTEENKYLKTEVGDALKTCITKVVLHQPADPVAYLAGVLTKYSDNIKAHQKHLKDEQERFELSQLIHTTKNNSEGSYAEEGTEDTNFIYYGRGHETDRSHNSF